MKMESLNELFLTELKDIYDAEHQVIEALPRMEKAAKSMELKQGFRTHLRESENHISRLEQVFNMMDKKPARKKCKGMAGVIKEGDEMMKEDADPDVRDAGLISSAQKVEHYEMATYGALRTYARMLGYQEVAMLLQKNLDEEGGADKMLTAIAESKVNARAMEHADMAH